MGWLIWLFWKKKSTISWWRHQTKTFSALLAICAANSPVTSEFLSQKPVTRGFDVFFDLRLSKCLSKQSQGWWFETPTRSLWRHRNVSSGRYSSCWQRSVHHRIGDHKHKTAFKQLQLKGFYERSVIPICWLNVSWTSMTIKLRDWKYCPNFYHELRISNYHD